VNLGYTALEAKHFLYYSVWVKKFRLPKKEIQINEQEGGGDEEACAIFYERKDS
jgi:uncharacterized metal-binding protein